MCSEGQIATCKEIQDSLGFWIPHRGFRIPGTGFHTVIETWILNSNLCLDSGFHVLYSGFQLVGFLILQPKISRIPEHGFPYVGESNVMPGPTRSAKSISPPGFTLAYSSERKLGILYAGNLKLPVKAERAYVEEVEEGEGPVTLGLA